MKRLLLYILLFTTVVSISAQQEFRGVWIATVANIDWPSKPALSTDMQKEEMIDILDSLQKLNINAIVVQVRPNSDAFYQSLLEPWSYWLTGAEGREPAPFYDPLTFICQEAHERCMEVHAWINPYRVDLRPGSPKLSNTHIYQDHPDWFMRYDGKLMFNPGLAETRSWLCSVVGDIVKRYDIDAIHMDDYFYPYPVSGQTIPDQQTFQDHPRGFTDIKDWRRNNVTLAIRELSETIRGIKPWVQLGISPFGVWRNKASDPRGSNTHALQNYDALYADILLWMEEGLIDYVAPQLYWENGHRLADYKTLLKWWSENRHETNFYVGLAVYQLLNGSAEAWKRPNEICRQIRQQQADSGATGAILYSCSKLLVNPRGLCDSLQQQIYSTPAINPCIARCKGHVPTSPFSIQMQADTLSWLYNEDESDDKGCRLRYFGIYENGRLVALTTQQKYAIRPEQAQSLWQVSTINRYNNESPRSTRPTGDQSHPTKNHEHWDSDFPIR